MNEQELRKLCKVTIKEEIIKNIDSALIFTYIKDLEEKIKMKDKIIKNAKQWIENTMNDSHIVGCNLGDLQMLLDILESE